MGSGLHDNHKSHYDFQKPVFPERVKYLHYIRVSSHPGRIPNTTILLSGHEMRQIYPIQDRNIYLEIWSRQWRPAETQYRMVDALAVAGFINAMQRQCNHVAIGSFAQSINVVGMLLVTPRMTN